MGKRVVSLSLIALLTGCSLVSDVEDSVAAKDLTLTHESISFDFKEPSNPVQIINPAYWGVDIQYRMKADNSGNKKDAKIGKATLTVVMNTPGAEPISLTNGGVSIPAGAVETVVFTPEPTITYATHKNAITYCVTQKVSGKPITMNVSGKYDFQLTGAPLAVVTIPSFPITY